MIKNIGILATAEGNEMKKGEEQGKIKIIKDAYIVINKDKITEIGTGVPKGEYAKVIDAKGKLVTPGLVDPHTHLVFGGWRENELADKLKGKTYLEILAAGGGILSTVKNTRNSTKEELVDKTKAALERMLKMGVTTLEAKSGYGLNLEDEIKMLEVVSDLNKIQPIELVSTFMGAHALPTEYKEKREEFINLLINKVIPEVANKKLAEFIDAFCEKGVFTPEECKKILESGKEHGMVPKCHTDEIEPIGGTEMAAELNAISCEHLIKVTESGIAALAKSGTIACCLPNTSFYLNSTFAPARDMINKGVAVAFGTDFNPGSCPSASLQLAMNMGCYKYKMTPEECLTAVTLNAAAAINRAKLVGTLEVGKQADILIWDAFNLNYLFYRFGDNLVKTVIKKGEVIVEN